ncbi:MAG: hypothetical protein ACJAZ1_001211 [Yoonia sp.]
MAVTDVASLWGTVWHDLRPVVGLAADALPVYLKLMKKVFDMDDRARLPWRFFGARSTILARG